MRTVLAVLTLFLATAAAAAGETYAVMSLIGDGLLVVRHRATTGTSLEGNMREFLTVPDPVFGRDAAAQEIVDALRPRLPANGATRLVLVVKTRHPAQIGLPRMNDTHVGSGSLEGLGYYVDASMAMANRGSTIENIHGFLAPFAYFAIVLADLKTGKVLAERAVYASTAIPESQSATLSPWDALIPERKVSIVEDLVRREVAQAAPALLAPR
jgi:hypothetical protein